MVAKKTPAEYVTEAMIAQLEKGVVPWIKDWKGGDADRGLPYNAESKKQYRGGNLFILWMERQLHSYRSNGWLTKNQINAAGGSIGKGQKATWVIFWKPMKVEDKDRPGKEKKILLQRVYMVWNVDQCEGLPEKYGKRENFELPEGTLEARMKELKIEVKLGAPAYHPELDYITMPKVEQFKSVDHFTSTEAHEVVHWTGHKDRLNRSSLVNRTHANYCAEELVAELGSAILCTMLGIKLDGLLHAEYLGHYINAMKEDPKFLLQSAGIAQKAVDYIMGVSYESKPE